MSSRTGGHPANSPARDHDSHPAPDRPSHERGSGYGAHARPLGRDRSITRVRRPRGPPARHSGHERDAHQPPSGSAGFGGGAAHHVDGARRHREQRRRRSRPGAPASRCRWPNQRAHPACQREPRRLGRVVHVSTTELAVVQRETSNGGSSPAMPTASRSRRCRLPAMAGGGRRLRADRVGTAGQPVAACAGLGRRAAIVTCASARPSASTIARLPTGTEHDRAHRSGRRPRPRTSARSPRRRSTRRAAGRREDHRA
jgi:hypothetical protein